MTPALPELNGLPSGLVLDGELVAWRDGMPYFPLVPRRILNGDTSIALTYMIFDLLRVDGTSLIDRPYAERRSLLEQLCNLGLEGVVAKQLTSRYDARRRGWVKVKNPSYWRRDSEREAMQRSRERRARTHV